MEKLTKLYSKVDCYTLADGSIDQAKLRKEVIADLVGEYLFTQESFVERLSVEHRDVFDRIFDEVKYDPSATNKEISYANPGTKPKNEAHKNVKYWYKFKNEIVFDCVPYTVIFNIRDKGAQQYQYLIDFHENKTPGLSNTAVKTSCELTKRLMWIVYAILVELSTEKAVSAQEGAAPVRGVWSGCFAGGGCGCL